MLFVHWGVFQVTMSSQSEARLLVSVPLVSCQGAHSAPISPAGRSEGGLGGDLLLEGGEKAPRLVTW